MSVLGDRIAERIAALGISQSELARRVGLGQSLLAFPTHPAIAVLS